MADQFVGTWNNTSSENFDAFLKEVGVGMMTRTIAAKLKPTIIFEINGEEWTMTVSSTFKTQVLKFKLGKEFDETTADGRNVTSTFTMEGKTLVQTDKDKNSGIVSRIERSIEGNTLTNVFECNGVKSVRVYERA